MTQTASVLSHAYFLRAQGQPWMEFNQGSITFDLLALIF